MLCPQATRGVWPRDKASQRIDTFSHSTKGQTTQKRSLTLLPSEETKGGTTKKRFCRFKPLTCIKAQAWYYFLGTTVFPTIFGDYIS